MINTNMKKYNYFVYGQEDAYGQRVLGTEPAGTITMSLYLSTQSIQDNINYKDCQYVGFTLEAIDDSYVIENGNERLKVLLINTAGRYTQVYMVKL